MKICPAFPSSPCASTVLRRVELLSSADRSTLSTAQSASDRFKPKNRLREGAVSWAEGETGALKWIAIITSLHVSGTLATTKLCRQQRTRGRTACFALFLVLN